MKLLRFLLCVVLCLLISTATFAYTGWVAYRWLVFIVQHTPDCPVRPVSDC